MEARELRMGNLLMYQGQVIEIDIAPLFFFSKGSAFMKKFETVEPIPLTEEWLLKFGCEQVYADLFKLDRHDYDFEFRIMGGNTQVKIAGDTLLKNLNYVHQLQNLYFALTGEELELKTPG